VPIAWIVRRVCVGDCRLCACSVCVCVCVCVCRVHPRVCHASRPGIALPGRRGGCVGSFRRERIGDSERNSSACVLSGVSRCGTCMCTELCRAGWVVAASMCCETTHLCVRHGVRVGVVCAVSADCIVIIDGGRWALCMCVSRGKPRCVSSD
jgi:hypothetical protein